MFISGINGDSDVCVSAGCLVMPDFATPWPAAHQAVLSTGFLLQGIEPTSPASPILFHIFFKMVYLGILNMVSCAKQNDNNNIDNYANKY